METVSPADYQYWKSRGWLSPDAKWFMDVPLNPLYRAIGKIAEMHAQRSFRKYVGRETGNSRLVEPAGEEV